MSKIKKINCLEPQCLAPITTLLSQNINHTRKIKPILWYKGVSPHDRDHAKQKKVRRYKVISEYENYPEELSFTLQKHPYNSRYSYQKQVQRLYVCFPTLDTLIKIVTNIPYRYTGLKGLYISLKGVIKGESLGRISKCLSKLFRVKALTLALYQKQLKIKDNSIANLDKSLSKLKSLKNLNLSFTENKIHAHQVGMVLVGSIFEVKDRGMVIFPHLFSLLTNLVKIDIAIIEQNTVTDGELENFGYRLSKLQNLANLSLNFIDCLSLSFKGFNAMLTQLAQLPQLNTLGIGFPIFEGIGNEMEVPTYHPIWQLETLIRTNLEIKLYAMFETELMDGLATSVAKIVSLEKLVLICNRAQFVINRHINALMCSLSKLPKVYHLDLDFVICQSLHASLANNIMYYITTMPNLQTVSLNFQTCFKRILGPPPQAMEIVMDEQLSRTQDQITTLALGYMDCQEMKEDQVLATINLIRMCPNVKDLSVKLNWCKILSDDHMMELLRTISLLKNLENLAIEFQGRYKGTRESFVELKKLRLPHLRSLNVNISNWMGVTDQDIQTLGKWIASFSKLEELKLNFKNCKGLSDFHAEKVCNYLVNLSRLRNLELSWTAVKLRETSNNIAGLLEKALPKLCYIQFYSGNTRVWMWMKD